MIELKIDPEFQGKIPPLTDDEFKQLRENIINDGEVYEPICVWNGTIVDGHNRWKIIQEFPDIPFRIKEMIFNDKWEAFDWMYSKQLGRRNLTDEQRTMIIGQMYEARKNSHGGDRKSNGKNYHLKNPTAEAIGYELGISEKTVRSAANFTKGIDALSEVSKEAADKVLKGNSGASKEKIMELRTASEEERKEVAEKILNGSIKKRKQIDPSERAKNKQLDATIQESVEAVRGESKCEYTLADALDELSVIEREFLGKVRRVFEIRQDLIKGNDLVRNIVNTWKFDIETLKGEI